MLALIIVVCITAITTLGTNANNTFTYVGPRSVRREADWCRSMARLAEPGQVGSL